jgi:hypothetical protein
LAVNRKKRAPSQPTSLPYLTPLSVLEDGYVKKHIHSTFRAVLQIIIYPTRMVVLSIPKIRLTFRRLSPSWETDVIANADKFTCTKLCICLCDYINMCIYVDLCMCAMYVGVCIYILVSLGLKRQGLEGDNSPPSSAEIKNAATIYELLIPVKHDNSSNNSLMFHCVQLRFICLEYDAATCFGS